MKQLQDRYAVKVKKFLKDESTFSRITTIAMEKPPIMRQVTLSVGFSIVGGLIGAAIGSVLPGLGTAIGAVVGAGIGAALSRPIEKLIQWAIRPKLPELHADLAIPNDKNGQEDFNKSSEILNKSLGPKILLSNSDQPLPIPYHGTSLLNQSSHNRLSSDHLPDNNSHSIN